VILGGRGSVRACGAARFAGRLAPRVRARAFRGTPSSSAIFAVSSRNATT
jgi:hypothetical protein